MNDHDVASPTAVSEFRGITVFEAGETAGMDADLTYEWKQTSGPAVTLDDANSTTPTFEAPDVGEDETITFEVTVSDGHNTSTEVVEVRVEANEAPVVVAADGGEVDERGTVQLSATIEAGQAPALDFESADIESFGGEGQDIGVDVVVSGDTLEMTGNGWKSVPMDVEITPDTVLEFEFRSDSTGEIHGIAFDTDSGISADRTFQLHGTQTWGIQAERSYEGSEGEWVTYRIPVGEHFTGDFDRIVFVNDHDVADPDGHSAFRGVRVVDASLDASGAIDQDLSYTWEQVGGPTVELSDANGLTPTFEAPEVGEPTELRFRVTASDGDNATSELVTITVNPVNDAPSDVAFTGGTVSESAPAGTVVATAAASDIDLGDSVTYSLADDADGRFAIDPDTGAITTTGELDFESGSSHAVRVVATDAGGLTSEGELTISVSDVNEGPGVLTFAGGFVSEAAGAGTVVGSASSIDTDAGDSVTYSLADDAGGRFAIDAETGEITTTGNLDFESGASHTLRVVATDSGGLTSEGELTVSVGDVNEGPGSLTFAGGFVSEAAAAGTVVGSASSIDTDTGDIVTYSLADDAGGLFAIDAETGAITTTGDLDFESGSSHTLRVVATDSGGLTSEGELTVSVADVNEGPVFGNDAPVVVSAVQGESLRVAAGATDPEGGELTYAWRQVGGPSVAIGDASADTLEFDAPNLESAADLVFVVEVSDGENTVERVVTVGVAAGDAGFDMELAEDSESTAAESDVDSNGDQDGSTEAARVAAAGAVSSGPAAEESPTGAGEPSYKLPGDAPELFEHGAESNVDQTSVSETEAVEWLASEISEIAEIAASVEPADLEFDVADVGRSAEVTFEEVFTDTSFVGEDGQPVTNAETGGGQEAGTGFLVKMMTLLRAGFGVQTRNDESEGDLNNRFKR
ncbi:MAG: cadherin domain-containing protein [Planctomycetota bacterium]